MAEAPREAPRGEAGGRSAGSCGRGRSARRLAERRVPPLGSTRPRRGRRRRHERARGRAAGRRVLRGAPGPRPRALGGWRGGWRLPVGKAAGLGFEPRLLGPEPSVLPLDDPATCRRGAGILAVARAGRGGGQGVTQRRPRAVLLPELEVLEAVGPFQATSAAQSP